MCWEPATPAPSRPAGLFWIHWVSIIRKNLRWPIWIWSNYQRHPGRQHCRYEYPGGRAGDSITQAYALMGERMTILNWSQESLNAINALPALGLV